MSRRDCRSHLCCVPRNVPTCSPCRRKGSSRRRSWSTSADTISATSSLIWRWPPFPPQALRRFPTTLRLRQTNPQRPLRRALLHPSQSAFLSQKAVFCQHSSWNRPEDSALSIAFPVLVTGLEGARCRLVPTQTIQTKSTLTLCPRLFPPPLPVRHPTSCFSAEMRQHVRRPRRATLPVTLRLLSQAVTIPRIAILK